MLLLTGANGFIGRALAAQLVIRRLALRCIVRGKSHSPVDEGSTLRIDSISSHQDLDSALVGVDTVIHAAARVVAAVGAFSDFYIGRIKRPHSLFRRMGLEWLPRLLREPRRLWRRMIVSAPIFLWHVLLARLKFTRQV